MDAAKIKECTIRNCAYNRDKKCHATAITVGGPDPCCDTFTELLEKGGTANTGSVGACKVRSCVYNGELECAAANIKIGKGVCRASCKTFESRMWKKL